jgi:hypothetical protein
MAHYVLERLATETLDKADGGRPLPPHNPVQLVRLTLAIDRAIGRSRTEVPSRLEALEVIQNRRRDRRPVREGHVFNEYDLARLIRSNTPEPGVRNDGSNHPGETLAPI